MLVNITKEAAKAEKVLAPALERLKETLPADFSKAKPGALVDLLYALRDAKQVLGAVTAPLEEAIHEATRALEEHFITTLAVGAASGLQGMEARVQITDSAIPQVADWDKFYEHIRKTRSFELLNRKVNLEAVRERWALKKQVPGVTVFYAKKVSCTKLNGRKK